MLPNVPNAKIIPYIRCLKTLGICLCICILVSCKNSSEETADTVKSAVDGAKQFVEDAYKFAGDSIPQKTEEVKNYSEEELARLQAFEYRVLELVPNAAAGELEAQLQLLGRERWDCFDIARQAEAIYVTCKRKPASWLRFMQRFVP